MNLFVGLLSKYPEWQILLGQIGINFSYLDDEKPDPDQIPVIILDQNLSKSGIEDIRDYVFSGGALLLNAANAKKIFGSKYKISKIEYIKYDNDTSFSPFFKCDLASKHYKISSESTFLYNQNNVKVLAIIDFGQGKVVIIPENFVTSVSDVKATRKNFPAFWGKRIPNERVSRISKYAIRQIINDALRILFHFRNLPFLHLSPVPKDMQTCFIFRIDTDMAASKDIVDLYNLCREYNIKGSWFIETGSVKNGFEDYLQMKNQEIAYHCFRHKVFSSYKKQKIDLESGLSLLKKADIEPSGYAAPFGEWIPKNADLLEKFNFQYSSEFSLNYDDLPFYPWIKNRYSTVLQIPIHPISTGRLNWAKFTEEEMYLYYSWVMKQKKALGLPIILYHHPGPHFLNVFRQIFQKIHQSKIHSTNMLNFAQWWKKRLEFKWKANYNNGKLDFQIPKERSDFSIRIYGVEGKWYSIYKNKRTTFEPDLKNFFEKLNFEKINKKSWRIYHNDLLWHYRKIGQ